MPVGCPGFVFCDLTVHPWQEGEWQKRFDEAAGPYFAKQRVAIDQTTLLQCVHFFKKVRRDSEGRCAPSSEACPPSDGRGALAFACDAGTPSPHHEGCWRRVIVISGRKRLQATTLRPLMTIAPTRLEGWAGQVQLSEAQRRGLTGREGVAGEWTRPVPPFPSGCCVSLQLRQKAAIWESGPAEAICLRAVLGKTREIGSQSQGMSFNIFIFLLNRKRSDREVLCVGMLYCVTVNVQCCAFCRLFGAPPITRTN